MGHHLRVLLLAVEGDHMMQDFVDQAQGVDLPGAHRLLGEVDQVALLVDFLGENPRGVEVGKDDVAVEREQETGRTGSGREPGGKCGIPYWLLVIQMGGILVPGDIQI